MPSYSKHVADAVARHAELRTMAGLCTLLVDMCPHETSDYSYTPTPQIHETTRGMTRPFNQYTSDPARW